MIAVDPGWRVVEGSRDWPDESQYMCTCVKCKLRFIGHKRRYVCKLCHVPDPRQTDIFSPEQEPI